MRVLITTAVVMFLTISVAVADEKDEVAKKLNGTYEVTEQLVDGKPVAKKEGAKQTVTIKDGTITLQIGDQRSEPAKFTLDPSKKPAHIDIMPPKKVGVDVVKGIYTMKETDKGLELIIAHNMTKVGVRPADFKGEGEKSTVLKLLRKKEQ